MEGLKYLSCDEMDRAWELFYKWAESTMKSRGVNIKNWKKELRRSQGEAPWITRGKE